MPELADRSVPGRKGSQITGLLLTAVGVFLLVSLVTHSKFDPPNSSQSGSPDTINWAGRIGAHISYSAFIAVGYSAYVLPLLSLLWGWNRLRVRPGRPEVVRTIGLLGIAIFLSVGFALPEWSPYTAFELGGWLGRVASALLVPYAGRVGSMVLLAAFLLASFLLATDLDPRRIPQLICAAAGAVGRATRGAGRTVASIHAPTPRRPPAPDEGEDERGDPDADEPEDEGEDIEPEGDDEDDLPQGFEPETASAPERLPTISRRRERLLPEPVGPAHDDLARLAPLGPISRRPPPEPSHPSRGVPPRRQGGRYRLPGASLLDPVPTDQGEVDRDLLLRNARILEEALSNFDVQGKVVEVSPGPVVTRYEVEPAAGVKVGRISALADDLARIMSARGIRIQAPVPGKAVVGVEIANHHRETVYLREIVDSPVFKKAESILTMALGKTISGETYVTDLARMPHLLVAGATGAGKSVCINGLICSILLRATPDQVRLLMVDPKVVELTIYNGIPHLLVPVITEPKRASEALKWAVAEMEARYQMLARLSVRNLADYNAKAAKVIAQREAVGDEGAETRDVAEGEEVRKLPFIVIIIDEFADLMLTAPADVETSLMGLAQKSRAVGIHIILATQRPSVNVITGVIKANFPSRIAFQVASKIDSRTILDMNGAERLLGRGDMLFLPGGQGEPIRIHGAYISGDETERLVQSIKESGYQAEEVEIFSARGDMGGADGARDELFDEAVAVVLESKQASTSFLQRRMKVGYSRAARLMDELEMAGIVGPADGAKPRQILVEGDGGPWDDGEAR